MSDLTFIHGLIAGVIINLLGFFVFFVIQPWIKSIFNAAPVPLMHILGMRLRGNPAPILIDAYIRLVKAEKEIELDEIELCYIQNKHEINDLATLLQFLEADTNQNKQ